MLLQRQQCRCHAIAHLMQLRSFLALRQMAGPKRPHASLMHSRQRLSQSGLLPDPSGSTDQATTTQKHISRLGLEPRRPPLEIFRQHLSLPADSRQLLSELQPAHCRLPIAANDIVCSANDTEPPGTPTQRQLHNSRNVPPCPGQPTSPLKRPGSFNTDENYIGLLFPMPFV